MSRVDADRAKVPEGAQAGKFLGAAVEVRAWMMPRFWFELPARGAGSSSTSVPSTTAGRSTAASAARVRGAGLRRRGIRQPLGDETIIVTPCARIASESEPRQER